MLSSAGLGALWVPTGVSGQGPGGRLGAATPTASHYSAGTASGAGRNSRRSRNAAFGSCPWAWPRRQGLPSGTEPPKQLPSCALVTSTSQRFWKFWGSLWLRADLRSSRPPLQRWGGAQLPSSGPWRVGGTPWSEDRGVTEQGLSLVSLKSKRLKHMRRLCQRPAAGAGATAQGGSEGRAGPAL